MRGHTHAIIDGENHAIAECREVGGAAHTHRVLLGCGLTVDVHADREPEQLRTRWHSPEGRAPKKVHCRACEEFAARGELLPEHVQPAHGPTRVTRADIPTGLPCPHEGEQGGKPCGAPLMIRRKDGTVGCTAFGHDFTIPEVLAVSMGLLRRLASAKPGDDLTWGKE
jgi:hypothetical protein